MVRPKTRDKWLKVSHDAGSTCDPSSHGPILSATLHLIVNMYYKPENPCVVLFLAAFHTSKRFEHVSEPKRARMVDVTRIGHSSRSMVSSYYSYGNTFFGVVEIHI